MAKLVSNRYALALFEAGLDLNKAQIFNEELEILKEIFSSQIEFVKILNHPKISKKEKHLLIDELFKGKISDEIINFLYILIDKRRETYVLDIIQSYKELFNEKENILRVVAVTATPMQEESKTKLIDVLTKKLGKKIDLSNKIDSSIIGGVLLNIENKQIDGTVKGQLEAIGKSINNATN